MSTGDPIDQLTNTKPGGFLPTKGFLDPYSNTTGAQLEMQKILSSYVGRQASGLREAETSATTTRREVRIFNHFAKLFVERFKEWELQPDSSYPLERTYLKSTNGNYVIAFDDKRGLVMIACTLNAIRRIAGLERQYLELNEEYFQGWVLGEEDVPDYITNP